jgi:CheY-like chemotaxis protein
VRVRHAPSSSSAYAGPPFKQVLYVEDQPLNVMLMQALLESRPMVQLRAAESGEEGYRRALESTPDLLLLDLRLPDGHGCDWLRCMRAHPQLAGVPAVAVTAEPPGAFDASGFVDVWHKPLNLMGTLQRFDELLGLPSHPGPGAAQWLHDGAGLSPLS